jgi:hypothetical protein
MYTVYRDLTNVLQAVAVSYASTTGKVMKERISYENTSHVVHKKKNLDVRFCPNGGIGLDAPTGSHLSVEVGCLMPLTGSILRSPVPPTYSEVSIVSCNRSVYHNVLVLLLLTDKHTGRDKRLTTTESGIVDEKGMRTLCVLRGLEKQASITARSHTGRVKYPLSLAIKLASTDSIWVVCC